MLHLRGARRLRHGDRAGALRDLRAARLAAPKYWLWLEACARDLQAAEQR